MGEVGEEQKIVERKVFVLHLSGKHNNTLHSELFFSFFFQYRSGAMQNTLTC